MKLIMVLVVPLLAMPTGSMGWTATTDMLSGGLGATRAQNTTKQGKIFLLG